MLFHKKIKGNLVANGVAHWLSQKTTGYSTLQKKIGFGIFCMLFSGFTIWTSIQAFRDKRINESEFILRPQWIRGPIVHVDHPVPKIVTENDFVRLESARSFLDSLEKYDPARFKQVMAEQPTLIENIHLLESIYKSQSR